MTNRGWLSSPNKSLEQGSCGTQSTVQWWVGWSFALSTCTSPSCHKKAVQLQTSHLYSRQVHPSPPPHWFLCLRAGLVGQLAFSSTPFPSPISLHLPGQKSQKLLKSGAWRPSPIFSKTVWFGMYMFPVCLFCALLVYRHFRKQTKCKL